MRIAVLADIHGNLPAFEAALDHVHRQKVDYILIAGDIVVGSPDSAACWQLAQSLGVPILRGNHERYVTDYGRAAADTRWNSEQFGPVQWAVSQLTDDQRGSLSALPRMILMPDMPDLLVVHASLRSDRDSIAAYTPEADLAAMFPEIRQKIIVRAHNHMCQVRLWAGRTIITTGSVGLALDGNPTAQYLILERTAANWEIRFQSVPYDVERVLQRFHETDYLTTAGPMARLFLREVATGAHHLVPFLQAYDRWSHDRTLALGDAVERFLSIW